MLQIPTPFPQVGSIGFLAGTAEPARILQRNGDGTLLVERRLRLPSGDTAPLTGASANRTVAAADLFEAPEVAIHGSQAKADKARRSRAAGRSVPRSPSPSPRT